MCVHKAAVACTKGCRMGSIESGFDWSGWQIKKWFIGKEKVGGRTREQGQQSDQHTDKPKMLHSRAIRSSSQRTRPRMRGSRTPLGGRCPHSKGGLDYLAHGHQLAHSRVRPREDHCSVYFYLFHLFLEDIKHVYNYLVKEFF